MTDGPTDDLIPSSDPAAIELVLAVRGGDVGTIRRLIDEHPDLPRWRVGDRKGSRTPLHMVADWPGYFPRGPEIARLLIDAGADPDGGPPGLRNPDDPAPETPLHWAASSDDVAVAAALIDGGADIEAHSSGPIAGPPLVNAVAYGCWQVARLLVARGAQIGGLWQAAALGDQARVDELLSTDPAPRPGGPGRGVLAGLPRWPAADGRVPARPGREHRRHARLLGQPAGPGGWRAGHDALGAGHLAQGARRPRGVTGYGAGGAGAPVARVSPAAAASAA